MNPYGIAPEVRPDPRELARWNAAVVASREDYRLHPTSGRCAHPGSCKSRKVGKRWAGTKDRKEGDG